MADDKFKKAFENAEGEDFGGVKFDEPDYKMLLIQDENDYLSHLRIQSAGLAYYTALAREAENAADELQRVSKVRYNELYAKTSETFASQGKKATIKEIESAVQMQYGEELEKLHQEELEAKSRLDYIEAFLEGWKQKSHTLYAMTQMITAGLMTPRESITDKDYEYSEQLARDIRKSRVVGQ